MTDMEAAVAHGYLSATVKGYAQKREQRRRPRKAIDGDWARALAKSLGQHGFVAYGPSPDGPVQ